MSARSRKLLRALERGQPMEMSTMTYAVADEKRIWGIDLNELEAILLKEKVAGEVWSRTVMVRHLPEIDPDDQADARAHFDALGHRGAKHPGEAWERPLRMARRPGQRRLTVNLISHQNGVGLSQDVALLARLLTSEKHEVRFCEWRDMSGEADVNVYLELFDPMHLRTARRHVGLFNLEWYDSRAVGHLRTMTQCWAKSREALEIYQRLGDIPCALTGFLSRDMYDPDVKRERRCLHVRGKASQKQTDVVIEAWRRHGHLLPPLTLTTAAELDTRTDDVPSILVHRGYLPDEHLRSLMNAHAIHVCPSQTEGWGHYITEALSCEAVVVTTDGSPMNEHVRPAWGALVPSTPVESGLVMRYHTDPDALAQAVLEVAAKSDDELRAMGQRARVHWEARQADFTEKALGLLSHL